MGRTLKRVPLDFSWPLNTTWGGYLNPFSTQSAKCPDCAGSGSSPASKRFSDEWYGNAPFDPVAYGATPLTVDHPGVVALAKRNVANSPDYYGRGQTAIDREARRLWTLWRGQWCHHLIQADVDALVAADRLHDFVRRPRTAEQAAQLEKDGGHWLKEQNGYTPTADEVNAWSLSGFDHDSINNWICVKARCERESITETECARCKATGRLWPSTEIEAACEAWQATDPSIGEGFQLWETTSEGSPQSPVFATVEALCIWCAENATTFGSFRASADKWREMLDAGFVCHSVGNAVFM